MLSEQARRLVPCLAVALPILPALPTSQDPVSISALPTYTSKQGTNGNFIDLDSFSAP